MISANFIPEDLKTERCLLALEENTHKIWAVEGEEGKHRFFFNFLSKLDKIGESYVNGGLNEVFFFVLEAALT